MEKDIPAKCPKSASPYNHCPFVFRHEDEMILSYISSLAEDLKRVSGNQGEEAKIIDRYACQITAYLNGRMHQVVFGA
jgi:hypothetical protein